MAPTAMAGGFVEPVDAPAIASALAARSPLLAIQRAGERLVAAGQRGHIVYSDDDGANWRQAAVPVSVDLLAVSFPHPKIGWAVGHEGVVLATRDAGATWTRQLSGNQALALAHAYYRGRPAPTPDEATALRQIGAQMARGGAPPFLDVFFENERSGFVVGAFNTILRTDDAGVTWVPWMDRTSNPQELHFYAVRGRQGQVFLAGEQGKVWRLKSDTNRFVAVPTPYAGTLFGLVAEPGTLIAYGMRGTVYHSADEGATWDAAALDSGAGITAGAAWPNGALTLVDQGGTLHTSRDGGKTFVSTRLKQPMPLYAVAPGGHGRLVLAGATGAFSVALP